MVMVVQYSM